MCASAKSDLFYCSAHNLDLLIMGYPKIVEDAKGVMYLNFYENMPYGLFHATFIIIEQPLLV